MKINYKKENSYADFKGFRAEINKGNDRTVAIVASSYLDECLCQLLKAFLIDDIKKVGELVGDENNNDCPIGTFSSRILTCYCLGLIAKHEIHDLTLIRKIRNYFAHSLHGASFDDEKIVSYCSDLIVGKSAPNKWNLDHRKKFVHSSFYIAAYLKDRISEVERRASWIQSIE
jgi:DNA-binding MltR family transcriptional regulator